MRYWLMKSEPDAFGIDDLCRRPRQTEHWDGVRNYQARNFMRDDMRKGDQAFFYHSSCAEPGIAGIVTIQRAGYPDTTALDPKGKYFDPKAGPENPIWYMVDVRLEQRFDTPITLVALKANPRLKGMRLLARGNRLSILPVTAGEWGAILKMVV